MLKRTVYLDRQRDVDLMRYLQRLQRLRGQVVAIRHKILAKKLGVSESTARRAVDRMVAAGHILRTHITRPRGGYICVYKVDTNVIYRKASTFRRARRKIEQVERERKADHNGHLGHNDGTGGNAKSKSNLNTKRAARSDEGLLKGLLTVARAMGIDDVQRGYLRGAALRYGVRQAWWALEKAVTSGYRLADLVRVTWGILKNQYPRGVTAT